MRSNYDAIGNIVAKTDINDPSCSSTNPCYTYGTHNALIRAVQSITPCSTCTVDGIHGGHNALFYYDANGNMNCVTTHAQCDAYASRSQTWTSLNQPASVVQGATNIQWGYDPSHQRSTESESVSSTITNYANYPEIGVMAERIQTGKKFTPAFARAGSGATTSWPTGRWWRSAPRRAARAR